MMAHIFLILLALYLIPLLRIGFFFIPPVDWNFLRSVNAFFGRIEWAIQPVRNSVVLLALIAATAWGAYIGKLLPTVLFVPFILLSIFSIVRYRLLTRKMSILAKDHPCIHPKGFFKCFYSGFGPFPVALPRHIKDYVDPLNCSFKRGSSPSKRLFPVMAGFFNTLTMANILVRATKWRGPQFAREVAGGLVTIWGSRALYLGRLSLNVQGYEKIKNIDGKMIFAVTHKSFLDFAVIPLVLTGHHLRFLAARDHFLDNPVIYLMMGRAMKLVGTIFVDRKKKKLKPTAAAHEASSALSSLPIELVIFPQGKRAHADISQERSRLDSGYYTSGTKESLVKLGGHIKKGTSHIAVDTALALKNKERLFVHVVPVGLINTGIAAPKGKLRIQTNTDILVKIGDPLTLTKQDVANMTDGSEAYFAAVANLHQELDMRLKGLLETHAHLEQRFFKDIRSLIPASDYEHVSVAMKAWRGKDYLIYTLLDCIYATDPINWPVFLRELCYLLVSDAPVASLIHFKERVVDLL